MFIAPFYRNAQSFQRAPFCFGDSIDAWSRYRGVVERVVVRGLALVLERRSQIANLKS